MVCYDYGVQGHYTRDCPKPAKACSYCKQEHNVEQCPKLIARWQAQTVGAPNPVRNPMLNAPNPNANANIQMIVAEPREPSVVVITRGGATMGTDQDTQTEPVAQAQSQVRPAAQKKAPLDVQK